MNHNRGNNLAKNKTLYVCSDCGYESAKWMGRCPSCGAWNKMEEQEPAAPVSSAASGPQRKSTVTVPSAPARTLDQIEEGEQERSRCGIAEFDRVLGGGIVFVVRYLVLLLKEYYRKPEDSSEKEQ